MLNKSIARKQTAVLWNNRHVNLRVRVSTGSEHLLFASEELR
jgi:hypothetical protein